MYIIHSHVDKVVVSIAKKSQLKKGQIHRRRWQAISKVLYSLNSLSKCANYNNNDFNDISKMTKAIKETRLLES